MICSSLNRFFTSDLRDHGSDSKRQCYSKRGGRRIGYTGTGRSTSFRYDALGRRTAVIETDGATVTETRYLWCGERLCQARDGADTVTRRHYAEGELAVAATGDTAYFYAEDHLGSVRDLRTADGQVQAAYDYDPYGLPTRADETNGAHADYRYAGLVRHAQSGLYLAHYRAYSPTYGQWLTRDPIGEAGGVNLYGYVSGNPINRYDPLGLVEYPDDFAGPLPPDGYYTSEMTQTECGRIPPSPPGADVSKNMRQADDSWNPAWLYDQVRNKGPWDYKQQGRKYTDFGNFNFGAAGAAFGLPDSVLRRGAGWANQKADPTRGGLGSPWGKYPYGDDPNDQGQIKKGINYCECMER